MRSTNEFKTGTVKFFNDVKGYGFIIPEEQGSPEVIVHYSVIDMDGHRTLVKGQRVLFTAKKDARGFAATCVQLAP